MSRTSCPCSFLLVERHNFKGNTILLQHPFHATCYPITTFSIWEARKWRKAGAGTQNSRHQDKSGGAGVAQAGAGVAQACAGPRRETRSRARALNIMGGADKSIQPNGGYIKIHRKKLRFFEMKILKELFWKALLHIHTNYLAD